ncbi:serine/threonine-protein kinase [Actinoplanes sp. ATCC 53533]|uniref:serine/threonine-protein kinase n=1 Tax=Actinoplanes sp. ATCC 53533 TaxID=1288362 RepID=UPI001315104A|nr:serine/threonine-protein kinase [Actinoplanes sp. ATCC 53533]
MTEGMARVVASRYQLLRLLGRGGMGAVWHAHDTLLDRDVAIKEIWHPSAGSGPVDPADPFIARALREARAAARLRHPGIVTVHDVVTDEGRPWIVMELISGRSLAQAIQEHGLLPERQTAEIGLQVLEALSAAHREGVAHRDVKPANILLGTDRVVLTDFGIAAIDDATALTATGQMVGSPAYLAPERINGLPATAATDLWAVGVTLYAAVTGRSPFQRDDTQATFAAILTSRPTPPAHAGRLWPVIKDLLVKDPARRLTTERARQLLANVAYPAGSPGAGTPAPGQRRPAWWPGGPRRRRSSPDGVPGTLLAPPPTLAAPTAHQEPPGKRGPGAAPPAPRRTKPEPAIAEPHPPGAATGEPAGAAAGEPAVTIERAAAETATQSAAAETATQSAAAETATQSAAAETATEGAGVGTASTVAAETAGLVPVPRIPFDALWLPGAQAVGTAPPVPLPEVARRPRIRTVWFAALAVGSLLLAGGILRVTWPEAGDGRGTGRGVAAAPSGGSSAPAGSGPVKPVASRPAAAPVNPSLDSCLVGTWRMTSIQVVNHYAGVDARFTGSGGVLTRIWPNGKAIDDYSKSLPLKATIKGARYAEVLRGVETSHVETRKGRLYSSEFSGGRTFKVTRNGKKVDGGEMISPAEDLAYICSETRMTIYGNKNASTQSFQRISHQPG